MSDPLSITGSVVGIVSFGLQVCKEIVSYSQAWRDCDEDIHSLARKAESLRAPLKSLRGIIEESLETEPETSADLEAKLMNVQHSMQRLKQTMERYQPTASSTGLSTKMKVQVKRAVYPFRKDVLREMESDLDGVQNVLQTTLLIYSRKDARESLVAQEKLLKEMRDMHCVVRALSERRMPPPSLLQSWNEQMIAVQNPGPPIVYTSARNERDEHGGSVLRSRTRTLQWQIAKKVTYYSRLLNIMIQASVSITTGSGGLSIAPSLHIQAARGFNTEQLRKIDDLRVHLNFYHAFDRVTVELQKLFSTGEMLPSDLIHIGRVFRGGSVVSLFDWICYPVCLTGIPVDVNSYSNLIVFMLNCGAKPTTTIIDDQGLESLCQQVYLRDQDLEWVSRLIELGAPLHIHRPPSTGFFKRNIRLIRSRAGDLVQLPEIARIIIQESEEELRKALESGLASPNDSMVDCSLLQFAFGWPRGVKVLLEAGANPAQEFNFGLSSAKGYSDSAALLLKAGCPFGVMSLDEAWLLKGSTQISMLVDELAYRRKRLWRLAQCSIPQDELPVLDQDAVLDAKSLPINTKLVDQGIEIPSSLLVFIDAQRPTICHQVFNPTVLQMLYDAGFRDVDEGDLVGRTPLMLNTILFSCNPTWLRRSTWLISKGGHVNRQLPRSRAVVAHFLALDILSAAFERISRSMEFSLATDHDNPGTVKFHQWDTEMHRHGTAVFLIKSIRDGCFCPCSPAGCSTLSVALRHIMYQLALWKDSAYWLRMWLTFLISWEKETFEAQKTIIRSLTFNALGFVHACCIELDTPEPIDASVGGRDEEELHQILEEQAPLLADFEQLVAEFELKLVQLGVPILNFLEGYWYTRILEYLSERDPYDEEHVREAKKVGVDLQAEEQFIPNRVPLLLRPRVEGIAEM